jgi:hypothetical protein
MEHIGSSNVAAASLTDFSPISCICREAASVGGLFHFEGVMSLLGDGLPQYASHSLCSLAACIAYAADAASRRARKPASYVRFNTHNGFKSDIALSPKSAAGAMIIGREYLSQNLAMRSMRAHPVHPSSHVIVDTSISISAASSLFSGGSGAHRNEENLDGSLHQIVSPIGQLRVNTVLIRLFGER